MALLPPPTHPRAAANYALLRHTREALGCPPPADWGSHTIKCPDGLWLDLATRAAALGTSISDLVVQLLWSLSLAEPRRVSRQDFPLGPAGDQAYIRYNVAKGRLGRQIVQQGHALAPDLRALQGPAPLEQHPEAGLPPANLPAGCAGPAFWVVRAPTRVDSPPHVALVILAVRTSTGSAPVEWRVRPEALQTAAQARARGVPVQLWRVLLAQDPPPEITTPEGFLEAAHRAYAIPFQYEPQAWRYPDEVELVAQAPDGAVFRPAVPR